MTIKIRTWQIVSTSSTPCPLGRNPARSCCRDNIFSTPSPRNTRATDSNLCKMNRAWGLSAVVGCRESRKTIRDARFICPDNWSSVIDAFSWTTTKLRYKKSTVLRSQRRRDYNNEKREINSPFVRSHIASLGDSRIRLLPFKKYTKLTFHKNFEFQTHGITAVYYIPRGICKTFRKSRF